MTGSTKKAEARRGEILEAAAACFRDRGLKGASIADICAKLKISPGHLYYYFKSKDAIVEALLDQVREAQVTDIAREIATRNGAFDYVMSGDYIGKTEISGEVFIDEITMWEVYAEASRRPDGRLLKLVHAHWKAADAVLRASIEASQAAGRIRADADVDLIMTLMSMAVVTAQMARFADPDFDPERYRAAARHALAPFVEPASENG